MRTNVTVDKNSPEYLARQAAGGRHNLLLVIIFTVVNLLFLLLEVDRYFLFSASVPYYTTVFCNVLDSIAVGYPTIGMFTAISLVVSVVILGVYLLCWFMSKKKSGWLIVALVLFSIDTLALLGFTVFMDLMGENILDFVFHAWVIYSLAQTLRCNAKLKALAAQTAAPVDPYAPTPTDYYGANPEL